VSPPVVLQSLSRRLKPAAQNLTALIPVGMLFGQAVPEIIITIILILFLAHCFMKRDWSWIKNRWFQVLAVLWVYIVVTSAFAVNASSALGRALPWIHYPLFAVALTHWILNEASAQRRLMIVLSATVLFLAADTLLQYFSGIDIIGRAPTSIVRMTGPFKKPMIGVILVWTAFPVFYFLAAAAPPLNELKKLRAISIGRALAVFVAILGTVLAVYLSGERMAFLLCLLGTGFAFLFSRSLRKPLLAIAAIGIVALIGISIANPPVIDRQIGRSYNDITNFWQTAYGGAALSAIKIWKDHPVTGIGLKNFRVHCPDPRYGGTTPDELILRCPLHPHNIYLEWLVEGGLTGFFLYFFAVSLWLAHCYRARKIIASDPILMGLLITALIRFWPLTASTSQFIPWSAAPFWLLIGFLLARIALLERTTEPATET